MCRRRRKVGYRKPIFCFFTPCGGLSRPSNISKVTALALGIALCATADREDRLALQKSGARGDLAGSGKHMRWRECCAMAAKGRRMTFASRSRREPLINGPRIGA
jgi:hypothetical protein